MARRVLFLDDEGLLESVEGETRRLVRRPGAMAALGFLGGFLVGAALYAQQAHQHSRALFSRYPMRRYLALGYLRGQPSVETVRLLRDFLAWEQSPRLRSRATEVLRCVEEELT